ALVRDAKAFLSGRSQDVQKRLAAQMEEAAEQLDFERAAVFRDRLRALSFIQQEQGINAETAGDADVVDASQKGGVTCIQIFFIRGGQNWGNRALFPRHDKSETLEDVVFAFLSQFYEDKLPPRRLLLDRPLPEQELLEEALSTRAGHRVSIETPRRGKLAQLAELDSSNASDALDRRSTEANTQARHLGLLAEVFDLEAPPQRIEVYDNSHIQGTNAVGAMIVAGPEGFRKNAYRKFNFRSADLKPGDDFAMMREMLTRRFARLQEEDPDRGKGDWPDLVFIDGGKGQLSVALGVLQDLGIEDMPMVGVAKGPDRNAGREIFHLADGREMMLEPNSPALFFIQRLRDEAHRFAIGSHRQKRARDLTRSPLDDIPGVGPARKRALLLHFGTAQAVARAGVNDLAKVDGISTSMAQAIYDHFNPVR